MAAREQLHQLSISSLSSMSVWWSHSPLLSSHTRGGWCPSLMATGNHKHVISPIFQNTLSIRFISFVFGDTKQELHRSVVKHWPLTADRINYIRNWTRDSSLILLRLWKLKVKAVTKLKRHSRFVAKCLLHYILETILMEWNTECKPWLFSSWRSKVPGEERVTADFLSSGVYDLLQPAPVQRQQWTLMEEVRADSLRKNVLCLWNDDSEVESESDWLFAGGPDVHIQRQRGRKNAALWEICFPGCFLSDRYFDSGFWLKLSELCMWGRTIELKAELKDPGESRSQRAVLKMVNPLQPVLWEWE